MSCTNKTIWLNCQITNNPGMNRVISFVSQKVRAPILAYIDGWCTTPPNIISQDVLFRISVSMMFKYVSDKDEALFIHQAMIKDYKTLKMEFAKKRLSELPF